MNRSITSAALAAILVIGVTGAAMAQDAAGTPDPGHPRVNEVQQRIDNQQNRVDQGVSDGQINAKQATRDDAKLAREQKSLNKDEAKDGGHITKANQKNLNKRLNKGSKRIHRQRKAGAAAGK
jgi:hypothetical protein